MNTNMVSLLAPLELYIDLTDAQFFQLCQNNQDYRFERTAAGEVIIMIYRKWCKTRMVD